MNQPNKQTNKDSNVLEYENGKKETKKQRKKEIKKERKKK
jgi:hypothetical protein